MPEGDAFMRLSACFYSQDWYLASQNLTKIHQKCIRSRVRAVLTQQIFLSPKAFPAGHMGNMSKGKDKGIEKICSSKPTWFDSRTAMRLSNRLVRLSHEGNCNKPSTLWEDICKQIRPQRREFKASEPRILNAVAVDEVHHTDALSPRRISVTEYF